MTSTDPSRLSQDRAPAIAVADRQLLLLQELGAMGMVVARAAAHASVAASHAVEVILADDFWQPETGRARALAGGKDAAEAFQKVSRSVRLTFALEKLVAEALSDRLAGVAAKPRDATALFPFQLFPAEVGETSFAPDRAETDADRAGSRNENAAAEVERLREFDRPDRLASKGFAATVNGICAQIGAEVDWETWAINTRALDYHPFTPKPPEWSEARPPPGYRPGKAPIENPRDGSLSP